MQVYFCHDAARPVLWNLCRAFPSVKLAWADGGYAGKLVTWARRRLKPKLTLEIVRRPDDLYTFQVLHRRWTLSWIKRDLHLLGRDPCHDQPPRQPARCCSFNSHLSSQAGSRTLRPYEAKAMEAGLRSED